MTIALMGYTKAVDFMKQKMLQVCTVALLALISISGQAQEVKKWLREDGQPNLKAKGVILAGDAMTVGLPLAAVVYDATRIHNLEKQAKNAAKAGNMATARQLESKVEKAKGTFVTPWRVAGAIGAFLTFYQTSKFEVLLEPRMVSLQQDKEMINKILKSEGREPVTLEDLSAR